jgi:hypothetical protein
MKTIKADFRNGLIFAVAAANDPDLFWRVADLDDPRKASADDLREMRTLLEDMVVNFGYHAAERPTCLADPLEVAIGYLNGLIE